MSMSVNIIGKIASIEGAAYARGKDGSLRQLKIGDTVNEDEIIVTSENGRAELELNDGSIRLLRAEEAVTPVALAFDAEPSQPVRLAQADSADEADAVSRAIAEGGSLDLLLEEPTAGLTDDAGDSGHDMVRVLRVAEASDPVGGNSLFVHANAPAMDLPPSAPDRGAAAHAVLTAPSQPPVAADIAAAGDEDAASIAITLSASDLDGSIVGYTLISLPANGTLYADSSLSIPVKAGDTLASATLYFVPDADWNGSASFAYTATDSGGAVSNSATASLSVSPINDAPVAADVAAAGDEDAASIAITLSASDLDGSILGYTLTSLPANGTLYADSGLGIPVKAGDALASATLYFVPDADWNGATSFGYTAIDNEGASSSTATASITVDAVNDLPLISGDDSGGVTEDDAEPTLSATGTLTVSDADAGESAIDTAVPVAASAGALGSLVIDAGGNWTYAVANADVQYLKDGEQKFETFTVTTVDGATHDIVITLTGTNDAPQIAGDDSGGVTEDDAEPTLSASGTLTVSDADAGESAIDTAVPVAASAGALGSLVIDAGGNWTYAVANADVQYLKDGEQKFETFTVTTVDGATHDIVITLTGTNDAPTAADASFALAKNTSRALTAADFGLSDPDAGDTLQSVKITSPPAAGQLLHYDGAAWVAVGPGAEISREDIDNGFLVFRPDTDATGVPYASFGFAVSDGTAYSASSYTLSFNVAKELTVSDPLPVDEGGAAVFVIQLSDARTVDTQLSLTLGGEAAAGEDYSPQLQYRVKNADGSYSAWTDVAGSTITLAAGHTKAEVKVATLADAVPNEVESLTLSAAISNHAEADMANTSATGTTVISDYPSLRASGPSYVSEGGDIHFVLELSSAKATATAVTISFAGVAALGADFSYSIDGGATWISDASSTVTLAADTAANPTFEVLVRTAADATAEIDELLTLIASTSDTGIANHGSEVTAASYIVDPITLATPEDSAISLAPAAGYGYALLGQGSHGTVTESGGTLTYTPGQHFSGTDSFTIVKTDPAGNSVTATVTVAVGAVADAPAIAIAASDPVSAPGTAANVVANGDFAVNLGSWTTGAVAGSGGAAWAAGALELKTGGGDGHVGYAQQSIGGLTSGQSYTFTVDISNIGNLAVKWGGSTIAPTSLSGTTATFTVTAGSDNTLRFESAAPKNTTVTIDNVSLLAPTASAAYTYTVNIAAELVDQDGSESLQGIVISSADVPASAVLKLGDGTVVAKSFSGGTYSWTVSPDQASGLKLTLDKPATASSFTLTATATSIEASNGDTAAHAASITLDMPLSAANDVPMIGDNALILSNEADFVGSVTQSISTYFSADGGNTFSWNEAASTLPTLYADGEQVTLNYSVSSDGLTGTVTGTIGGGATTVFTVVIELHAGGDADITYTQHMSLLGVEEIADGGIVLPGGGNNGTLVLGFKDASGNIVYDAVLTSENVLTGASTTVNTNNIYIGVANNLMNASERLTMDFGAAGVSYDGGTTSQNEVASMTLSFFNFDSSNRSAPDELTITGWTVGGNTFTYHVTNADLDGNGNYIIAAPGGELISKLAFESGSTSSYKLGILSISSVRYDVDFDMQLGYRITDADGDYDDGTVRITLDGDDVLIYDGAASLIDGGSGTDTMILHPHDAIDFSMLGSGLIRNIESIDLNTDAGGGNTAHALNSLSLQDLLGMTDDSHQLTILGDANDSLSFRHGDGWVKGGTAAEAGRIFDLYTNAGDASVMVRVEQGINDHIL